MTTSNITISSYTPNDHTSLLTLLLELQDSYFKETAPASVQEVRKDKDIMRSYDGYIQMLNNCADDMWHAWLAKTPEWEAIGFIIGSIEDDEELVHSRMGKVEDWYVKPTNRNTGTGKALYDTLEQWFREKGCTQVCSETWQGNQLSIDAHLKRGFFISGISFGKKL